MIGVGVFTVACVAKLALLCTSRLVLDDTGATAKNLISSADVRWDEVSHYTFWSADQVGIFATQRWTTNPVGLLINGIVSAVRKAATSPNQRFSRGRMMIVSRTGRLTIDRRYQHVAAALDRAFAEIHTRLKDRKRRRYDPFTLDATTIAHDRNGTIAVIDIADIAVVDREFKINLHSGRRPWTSVATDRVANVMLLLEELGERGVVVDANQGMFVPSTVRASLTRHAKLPRAQVHT